MALLECDKARYLESHTDILDRRDIKRIKALQRIVDHEKPNSSAVVKSMAAIAREVL
jgi:tRNA(His) 5'-end guanylyltransferase